MDIVGPFLVDIDNEDRAAGDSGLADALSVARMTLEFLVEDWKLVQADFQIFFSGHKGFNIEVRPLALGLVGTYEQQIERSKDRLDSVIRVLRSRRSVSEGAINAVSNNGTVIDRIYSSSQGRYSLKHPYVRLRGSVNSWLKPDRVEISRLRTELAAEDLFALSADEVVALAET